MEKFGMWRKRRTAAFAGLPPPVLGVEPAGSDVCGEDAEPDQRSDTALDDVAKTAS